MWNICISPHSVSSFFLSPAFLFLSQPPRNVNRCWLHFQSARHVMGQKNNWREHLFSTRLGNWIPIPNHTWESKTKRHYPQPFLLSQLKISTESFHPVLAPLIYSLMGGMAVTVAGLASHLFGCTTETPCGGKSQTKPRRDHQTTQVLTDDLFYPSPTVLYQFNEGSLK